MQTIRVLIVDDHPSLRAGVRNRLSEEDDIEVVGEAASGEDALKRVEALKPHIVILDMQIQGLSGIEVARRLHAAGTAVRLLALSAHDDPEYITELLDHGASGYLTKSESLETIVSAVRGIARGEEGWLSRDAAAALMRHRRERMVESDDPLRLLSEREREVLSLLALGLANGVIADKLFISESTVKKHVNNIYFKLELNTRAEAVAWAWKNGLVE